MPFRRRSLLLATTIASVALALPLYLGLDLPEATPAQSYAADPDTVVEVSGLAFAPPHVCFNFCVRAGFGSVARFGLGNGGLGA